jgi:hypothetical protein
MTVPLGRGVVLLLERHHGEEFDRNNMWFLMTCSVLEHACTNVRLKEFSRAK